MIKTNKIQTRKLAIKTVSRADSEEEETPDNVVRVRASREIVDSYGTLFVIDGMDLSRIQKEPAVYLGHNDRVRADNLSVARVENLVKGVDEEGVRTLDGDLVFDPDDELAMTIARKMKQGFMSSVSIKAAVDYAHAKRNEDGIIIFGKSELIGIDIVGRGGNKDAVVLGRSWGFDDEEVELLKTRYKPEEMVGKVLSRASEDKLREAAEAILSVLGKEAPAGTVKDDVDERAHGASAGAVKEEEEEEEGTLITEQREVEVKASSYLDELLSQVERKEGSTLDWLEEFEF